MNMIKGLRKKEKKRTLILATQDDLEEIVENAISRMMNKKTEEDVYITREETAKRLNVDYSTLWRWNKDGFLLSVKSGRNVKYRLSEVEELAKGNIHD